MIINFVANYEAGMSGESADETHLASSLESLGHTVRRIQRDEWREHVISGKKFPSIKEDMRSDINLIAKWHHFYDGSFIRHLRHISGSPVFYWVWDSLDLGIDWHREMAQEADLYLSGELGRIKDFYNYNIRFYYFQMDIVDELPIYHSLRKEFDVLYLGTCDNQNGRVDLLKEINRSIPIDVFGSNWEEWQKQGFRAYPAVFGQQANEVIAKAKIVLGTSCDPHLWGYWSNRVGRVLYAKGKLLQQYTPGMENYLHDFVEYYSSAKEAIEKINAMFEDGYLWKQRGLYDNVSWTSKRKMKDLCILIERYLKEDNGKAWQL